MKYIFLIVLSSLIFNCKTSEAEKLTAESIVNNAIEVSGGDRIDASTIDFDFRGRHYYAKRNHGKFSLIRLTIENDIDSIFDIVSNNGFERHIHKNQPVFVEDSMKSKYAASVNSVHYFSVLPYGLNDNAVIKTLLGETKIKGENYYAIEVTFDKNGGGEDYEDVFLYWIHQDTFKVEYLAYSYAEDDGFGVRFREAYNERYIDQVRFVDYNNYKTNDTTLSLSELAKLFENGQLELLSKIELKDVKVN